MVLVLLLGFALGAAQLNADILWVDEMHSVSAFGAEGAPVGFQHVLQSIVEKTLVPLYYIAGAGWAQLVGWLQVPLRYMSLLIGVLSIAWIYRLGADVINRRTALFAAFLFATNALVIIYFHELRFYTMWICLSLAHTWHYLRLADGAKAGKASWFIFVASTSVLLYSHPFASFVFLGIGIQHVLLVARNRRWFSIVTAWVAGLLTFLPYIPPFAIVFADATSGVGSKADSTFEIIPMLANVLTNGVEWIWVVLIVAGGWALWRKRTRQAQRLLMVTVTIVLALFVFHEFFPFLSATRLRYFLVALTFALILFAHFLVSNPHWRILVPAFAILWAAGGYNIYQQAEKWEYAAHRSLLVAHPPLHRFADALQYKTRQHDALLGFIQATFLNNGLHFGFSTVEYYSQAVLGIYGAFIYTELEGSELEDEFLRRVDNHPFLLFTYEKGNLPSNFDQVKELLERDYSPCAVVVDTEAIFVLRYVDRTLPCDREYQPIHYDNGVKIVDKFAHYDAEAQSVRVVTGWEVADEEQLDQYNVSVQIITPDWQRVRQAPDRHLYDDVLKWYVVDLSTEDLPPGDYRAMVILYDRDTIKKVKGTDLTAGHTSDIFSVLTFTIDP